MTELQPEGLEDLVEELGEEGHAEEPLPSDVEELLGILQSNGPYLDRRSAALELGNLGTSSPRILQALTVAQASDPHPDVRRAAAGPRIATGARGAQSPQAIVAESLQGRIGQLGNPGLATGPIFHPASVIFRAVLYVPGVAGVLNAVEPPCSPPIAPAGRVGW